MARIVGTTRRTEAARAALRMYAEFAHCMTETMEYYGPRPAADPAGSARAGQRGGTLREGRGAVVVTGHFGNWDIAAKTLREYDRPINVVMGREINETTQGVRPRRPRARAACG